MLCGWSVWGHSLAQIMNRRLILMLCVLVLLVSQARGSITEASGSNIGQPSWSSGTAQALKKVSSRIGAQHEPSYLNNLDCTLIDYRNVGSSEARTGCFSETAYGLFDSDSATVIFGGTDEALPLIRYSPGQILAPWPKALNLVSLGIINTGGATLSIYRNPLNVIQDIRNPLGQLSAKQLTGPADLVIRDASGSPLIINPRTIAFSDNGSWLVAETLSGSFTRLNLTTLSQLPFAPAFGSQGSTALLNSRVAISDDGYFVAVSNHDAGTFKVYDLANCAPASGSCPNRDYRTFIGQQIAGLQSIQHIRFVNRGLISLEAQTSNTLTSGIYELAPSDSIDHLIDYLGLGDSYTSGEGAFDYLSGTDLENNSCHLSAKSYPLLLTRDLFSPVGGHSVACSGAVIRDVASTSDSYRGQVRDVPTFSQLSESDPALLNSVLTNFVPGYIAQQRFAGQYQPRIMTVSVGGDDVGFGAIVQNCVVPHLSRHLSDSNCYNTYEDRLELKQLVDRTTPRWISLYKQLLKNNPDSRIYAIGYPMIASDIGNCSLNAHLGKAELEFSQEMIVYINQTVEKAAKSAGVSYVDIGQALVGHRLCETAGYNVAVNGLTAGKDGSILGLRLFGKESYHPNALGQELIEQAILSRTRNFTVEPVATTPLVSKLLEAPKTGRSVQTVVPDSHLAPAVVSPGKSISVKTNGGSSGLKANTAYKIRLDGPGGAVIGTLTSDINGDISGTVTIPLAVLAGGHTIDVTGENQVGQPVDVTQPVYVPASDNDADGDGFDNSIDSCPGVPNSGVDEDRDGIDDVCDPMISQPDTPATPSPPPSSSGTTPTPSVPPGTLPAILEADGDSATGGELASPILVAATLFSAGPIGSRATPAQVLGASTISPQTGKGRQLVVPKPALTQKSRSLKGLPRLNWYVLLVLAAFIWLLMVLTAIFRRRSTVQYAHGLA